MRVRILSVCFLALFIGSCREARIKDHAEWGKFFEDKGIKNACFILRDNNHESVHYYNKERCLQRFLPASTFKIVNSLIALESAVASDDQLAIKWDGVTRRPEWDKDMTMREAFKVSNVPFYQEVARRIGPARMKHYIDTLHYGNMKVEGSIDNFWLNNSLQVSADEQIGLLKRMYFGELPMTERSQRIVKTMMLQEETPGYKVYYKTGTGETNGKTIYWVVGFAEKIMKVKEPEGSMNKSDERNYPFFFAENFELPTADTSKNWNQVRLDIMHDVLKSYDILPK
jgi:beta-lactamase class D